MSGKHHSKFASNQETGTLFFWIEPSGKLVAQCWVCLKKRDYDRGTLFDRPFGHRSNCTPQLRCELAEIAGERNSSLIELGWNIGLSLEAIEAAHEAVNNGCCDVYIDHRIDGGQAVGDEDS